MKKTTLTGLFAAAAIGFAGMAQAAQPHMEAALKLLEAAKTELQRASEDKGGHKATAMDAVDRAINQTKKGMEYDASRPDQANEGQQLSKEPAMTSPATTPPTTK